MRDWSIKLENADIKDLFPQEQTLTQTLQTIDHHKKIHNYSPNLNTGLSSVEQLLLAKYYAFGRLEFQDFFINPEKIAPTRMNLYVSHFYRVTYFYSGKTVKIISLEEPLTRSLDLFEKLKVAGVIHPFVKSIYLQPYKEYSHLKYTELYKEPSKASYYQLNEQAIEPLKQEELNAETELIDFFRCCYPDGIKIEPNRLKFHHDILTNYAIRLLASIYNQVNFIVKSKSKRIALIGAN